MKRRLLAYERESAKRKAAKSLEFFCQYYLKDRHFKSQSPDFHKEIFEFVQGPEDLKAVICPREHAKTTIETGEILWRVCFGMDPYQVIFGATATKAEQVLANVKYELKENPEIIRDFGVLIDGSRTGKDNDSDVMFRDGSRLQAYGAGSSVRGLNHRGQRPTRVYLDDIEDDVKMQSAYQRKKLEDWVNRVVIPMMAKNGGKITLYGNILHKGDLVSQCRINDQWSHIFFAAIMNGKSVWPEMWPLESLHKRKLQVGSFAFSCEYMNSPVDPESAVFREEDLNEWSNAPGSSTKVTLDDRHGNPRFTIYGAIDPAHSQKTRNDFFVMWTIGVERTTNEIFLLDLYRKRARSQDHIAAVLDRYKRFNHFKIACETNALQEVLKDWIEDVAKKEGLYLPLYGIHNHVDKYKRIVHTLQPLAERKQLWYNPNRHHEFLDEFVGYPDNVEHDDILDALEMAVRISERGKRFEAGDIEQPGKSIQSQLGGY